MGKIIRAVDLFCGAGGTSTGLALAAEAMGLNLQLTAINHWDRAIETHAKNHPWANHLQTDLDGLKPSSVIRGHKLDLLVASPECTHHSIARGGKPRDDQSRASAWHVLYWCQELYIKNILIENVPEFMNWGPLGADRRPLKSKKGHTFQAFVMALQSLGYCVDWRILNCANYGDATTRQRFFLAARRGRRPVWPVQTHGLDAAADMFGQSLHPWKPARDIIDWSIPGHSLFLSPEDVKKTGLKIKRPLAENTKKRISAGIKKYWGDWATPFLVLLRGTGEKRLKYTVRAVDQPVPTVSTSGAHIGLCRPFLVRYNDSGRVPLIDNPVITLDISTGAPALIQPFMMHLTHGGRLHSINNPVPAMTCANRGELGVIQPFIIKYYGGGSNAVAIDQPLDTVTTDDRFGICRPVLMRIGNQRYLMDILFRMLTPKELAAAHSFPVDYSFAGTKTDVVKQIGNSVPVRTARALCEKRLAA